MKPTKNKVFCKDCDRNKMLFESEKKAENFIRFNKEEIEAESGYSPERSYYCLFCGGWHITSIKENIGTSKKEQFFEEHKNSKVKTKYKNDSKIDFELIRSKKIEELQSKIKEFDSDHKVKFFSETVIILNEEIKRVSKSDNIDKERLKDLRQNLEVLYFVRKQTGLSKKTNRSETLRERELEEWKLWAEKKGYNIEMGE